MHWWEELSDQEQCHLVSELEEVDLEEMESMWRRTCGEDSVKTRDMSSMEPVQADLCDSIMTSSHDSLDTYINTTHEILISPNSLHLISRLDLCSNASFIILVTRFTKFYSNMAIYFNYLINSPEKWHHFAHVRTRDLLLKLILAS